MGVAAGGSGLVGIEHSDCYRFGGFPSFMRLGTQGLGFPFTPFWTLVSTF